jgi:thioesterase domain-containing protein/acyl carrier protein
VLKRDRVGIHDNFFDSGGHSLLAVRLISEMEKVFNQKLPLAMLFQFPTVEQLAGALFEKGLPGRSSLVPIQSIGSQPPFFFVHGDYAYAHFTRYLDRDRPFYGLAQHLEGKIRHSCIEDIAADYIGKIRTVQPDGPYFIGGHSVGALIAFEMAQQLHKAGQKLALLALLESSFAGDSAVIANGRSVQSKIRQHALNLSELDSKAKLNYVLKWLQSQLRTRIYHPYCKRLVCEIYHVFRMHLPLELEKFYVEKIVFPKIYKRAARNYRPKAYPGRVVYFKAREDMRDSAATWRGVAQGGVEVHEASGDHLSMLLEPHARDLAEELTLCLSKAQAGEYVRPVTVEQKCALTGRARGHLNTAVSQPREDSRPT